MGASEEALAQARAQIGAGSEPQRVRVLEENWHAAQVFCAMSTQWRRILAGNRLAYIGLDYGSLPIVLREFRQLQHRRRLEDLMPQIRELEEAALAAVNP